MTLFVLKNSRDNSYYRMTVGIGPLMTSSLDMAAKLDRHEALRVLGQHWALGDCDMLPLQGELDRVAAAGKKSAPPTLATLGKPKR